MVILLLTLREREILDLVVEGYINKQIAAKSHTAEQTVKNQLHIIYRKLEAANRAQAVAKYKDAA